MGVRDWFRGKEGNGQPAGMVSLAKRSFIFPDMDSAQQFQSTLQSQSGGSGGGPIAWMAFAEASFTAGRFGGEMFRSTTARELRVYGHLPTIRSNDRRYLVNRDPTAALLIERPGLDTWNGFPLTYIPEIDAYFSEQMALGLLTALQAGYQEYNEEGGAFVLLETDGDPARRLRRGERPVAWTFIPACNVIEDPEGERRYYLTGQDNVDQLLDHGIEYIWIYPTEEARAKMEPIRVHGSRLIPINLDPRKQKWWRTPNAPLNRFHDSLWDLRDIIFGQVRAQFQGDPIVVDVDLSADAQKLLQWESKEQKDIDKMGDNLVAAITDFNSGAETTFAPVLGFKMRRLGAAQLPDPKEIISTLVSRLSNGSPFPPKMVVASTKGNTDVSDQDLLMYQGNIQTIRNVWGYRHLAKALLMGRTMGANSLRMQDEHALPPPAELTWPLLRPLSPRDAAFTQKTDIAIYREAQEAGLKPPARLLRMFPEDTRYPIPLWLAARGRDTDGKNTDVAALNEPGAAGEAAVAEAVKAQVAKAKAQQEYAEWLESEPKPVTETQEIATQ